MSYKYEHWYCLFAHNDVVQQLVSWDFSQALKIRDVYNVLVKNCNEGAIYKNTLRHDYDVDAYKKETLEELHQKSNELESKIKEEKESISAFVKERTALAKLLIKKYPDSEFWKKFIGDIKIPNNLFLGYAGMVNNCKEPIRKERMQDISSSAYRFQTIDMLLQQHRWKKKELEYELEKWIFSVKNQIKHTKRIDRVIEEETHNYLVWKVFNWYSYTSNTYTSENIYQDRLDSLWAYIIDNSDDRAFIDKMLRNHSDKYDLFEYYLDPYENNSRYPRSLKNCITLYKYLSKEDQDRLFAEYEHSEHFMKVIKAHLKEINQLPKQLNIFSDTPEEIIEKRVEAIRACDFYAISMYYGKELSEAIDFVLFHWRDFIPYWSWKITPNDWQKNSARKDFALGIFKEHLVSLEKNEESPFGNGTDHSDLEEFIVEKISYKGIPINDSLPRETVKLSALTE